MVRKIHKNPFRIVPVLAALSGLAFTVPEASTVRVGPSQTYKLPSAAAGQVVSGDTVLIDAGTYTDTATWRTSNITLRGTAEFAHLVAPAVIWNQKAIWVVAGNNVTIENIEFSGATVPDQNGAGIRQEGNNVTIRHCYFHDCDDGILEGASNTSNVLIEYSEFDNNGFGDGQSHNMYIGHAGTFTLRFCYTHHAKIGHLVKSRARVNYILYNRILDEADGTASYEINLPNGGTSYVIGNLIQQSSTTDNSGIIDYGSEGYNNPATDLYVVNNTVVNDRGSGTFVQVAGGAVNAQIINNIFCGGGTVRSGPGDTLNNLVSNAPGFVNRTAFDYHLVAGAAAINGGRDPGLGNAFSLTPAFQYVNDCDGQARVAAGALDRGAYEYDAASINRPADFQNAAAPRLFFNAGTIHLYMPAGAPARLKVFDLQGRRVAEPVHGYLGAGLHSLPFAERPRDRSSGVYFYFLQTPGADQKGRIPLVR